MNKATDLRQAVASGIYVRLDVLRHGAAGVAGARLRRQPEVQPLRGVWATGQTSMQCARFVTTRALRSAEEAQPCGRLPARHASCFAPAAQVRLFGTGFCT